MEVVINMYGFQTWVSLNEFFNSYNYVPIPLFPFTSYLCCMVVLCQRQFNHDDKLFWMFYLTVSYSCTNLIVMNIDELLQQE
jgi:hypothetical protein